MSARRGMTVLELSVAAVILLATLTVAIRFLGETSAARRAMARESLALQEAANILERLNTLNDADAAELARAPVALSDPAKRALAGGTAKVELSEPRGEPPMRRVVVRVAWEERPAGNTRDLELVGWRSGEVQP